MNRKAKKEKPALPIEMVSVPAHALRRHLNKIAKEYQTDPAPVRELRQALESAQGGR